MSPRALKDPEAVLKATAEEATTMRYVKAADQSLRADSDELGEHLAAILPARNPDRDPAPSPIREVQ